MFADANWVPLLAVGLLVGIACWCLLYGLIWLFRGGEARVRARIKVFVIEDNDSPTSETQQQNLRRTLFSQIDERLTERTIFGKTLAKINADLSKADLHLTATEFLLIQISIAVALVLIGILLSPTPALSYLTGGVGLLLGLMLPRSYLRYMGDRRVRRFEEQLPDTLSILASSVRGGFSLFQALQLISREAAEPVKTEFLRVIHQVSLGAPMDDALAVLSHRIPTEDVDILVTAIALQHQTGGNLAHVLEVVAGTVRERHRVEREIRSMTAQQRFSGILLASLPFLLAGVLFIISPTYISRLFSWGWVLCMPVGALISSVVGLLIMRRISGIDV